MAKGKGTGLKVDVVEALRTEIGCLRDNVKALTNMGARFVLPQESMDELVAELRALRYAIAGEASKVFRGHEADVERELAKIRAKRNGGKKAKVRR
jgi:hypothetical protein